MNFVEELTWRGMLHTIMPGTEDMLNKGMASGYIGFDPTADSLHVGHLTQIMTLIHFQRAGHKPYALVGGATGMVGDPSGKSAERNLLSEDILQHNLECVEKQLAKFLDFESGANSAEMVNNYDWFKNFTFLDFIRDVGKHITVNYMMAKDSVKKRLEGETGMSFTEFTYQLVQGYDFYYLWKHKNCALQMGGSDQWGNIVTGTEFIRRKDGGEAFALTTQLIKKADGTKFGKTESGAVWLDPAKTSPYNFYQFWLNTTDVDAKSYIRIFTLFEQGVILAIEAEHEQAPHQRALQKALAKDITIRVHGEQAYEKAIKSSEFLFGNIGIEFLNELNDEELKGLFEGVPHYTISTAELAEGINAVELLATKTAVFPSKGEARKMIQAGGTAINKTKIASAEQVYTSAELINGKFLIAQKGKKNYFLIIAE
ncbi:tyrosine--tRNA ligase [Mucilaginibacter polytrichastri]|uniref:Tyrosine--tRNA ligase n=1 Tax=Mucilaginibacter polytrichastri TaxID=1302689 RepID=A0A1Q6A114_9SPHI|nr:tyrosine--tRNA ligase [Mucilaginibacter polytrichastri]OKS87671.1 Tyrosine--tRNA ligase [Mucilaginibacter polytrichastri]SFT20286.1 tyrosyl-tRNA synthetase [Mucilaginibacter polytrichastri]